MHEAGEQRAYRKPRELTGKDAKPARMLPDNIGNKV